jgi:hypothetical protein
MRTGQWIAISVIAPGWSSAAAGANELRRRALQSPAVLAREIPTAFTPPGGYGDTMPPPILTGCDEALVAGAPDLRGTWRVVSGTDHTGAPLTDGHPILDHEERIEQGGDRVVVTTSGIIHDMVADGILEHGVHDVNAGDFSTEIHVTATFEDGALVLRPDGLPGVEVKRWRDGDRLVWQYHTLFTVTMERLA